MPEPCEVGRVCGYIFFSNIIHEHTCTHGPGKYMGRTPRLGTRRPWRLGPAGAILEGLGRSFNLLRPGRPGYAPTRHSHTPSMGRRPNVWP